MKRIIIICEGHTEKVFCEQTLYPYFQKKNIYTESPLIKKSNGGIIKWDALKKQIENHLKQDASAYVSLLIDYYGISAKYEFPGWKEAESIPDKNERLHFLESQMQQHVDEKLNYRFIPYMQLHEFEGLLFNEIKIFYDLYSTEEIIGKDELINTFQSFPNPEMINNSKETAPSKRLERIISGYNKILDGNILTEAIGLERIKAKSPRFCNWINQIASLSDI